MRLFLPSGYFFWGGDGSGWVVYTPICVCLVGPLHLTQDYVTPTETVSPGTQPANRIRVSGFETGKHQGREERRTLGDPGWRSGLRSRLERSHTHHSWKMQGETNPDASPGQERLPDTSVYGLFFLREATPVLCLCPFLSQNLCAQSWPRNTENPAPRLAAPGRLASALRRIGTREAQRSWLTAAWHGASQAHV